VNRQTASEIDLEKRARFLARGFLFEHPEEQARVVAEHYLSHAHIARALIHLIGEFNNARRHGLGTANNMRDGIEILLGEIKRDHLVDFGIPLEWRKETE
jgi:hypothetical protein